ncbi:hypothetical protein N7453_001062 [Penicillium expansum]|nr:hypothetical protein N7453_001062 [Penicillium expansum]
MTGRNFEVREITIKEEFARLNDVLWTANFHPCEPAFIIFHAVNGHAPEDRAKDKARDTDLQWAKHEQTCGYHYIYTIERSTGRVVGGCQWIFYHENPFPNGPHQVPCTWYPAGSERAKYASHVATQFLYPRQCWFQRPRAGVLSFPEVNGGVNES